MAILKNDGKLEEYSIEKLTRSLELAGAPDPGLAARLIGDGITSTRELADKAQLVMLNLVPDDLRWHDAARNYLLWSIYKQVLGKNVIKAINNEEEKLEDAYREGFKAWFRTGLELRIWDSEMSAWYAQHIDELAKYLDPSRDLLLTYNGVRTLMSRYLLKRLDGTFFEVPQYLWMRTAMGVAYAELKYGGDPVTWARRFYDMMSQLRFMPNSPTLYNAMTRLGQLSACFVVPVDDCLSRESDTNREDPECNFGIMDALRLAALIFQSGGGVGYNFGKLRPEGDIVRSTTGIASGPLSFMKLFDTLVDTIKQGGKRRGAQMGMLFWWHPDIEKFITSKSGELKDVQLQNFNISVTIDDYFMQKALKGEDVYLINPRECPCLYKTWGEEFVRCYESCVEAIRAGRVRIWRRVNAKELWGKIVRSAWDSGDPGLWNRDLANLVINERVPGRVINGTNPCVSGDTRVLTPKGWVKAREVFEEAKASGIETRLVLVDGGELGIGGEPVAYRTSLVVPYSQSIVYTTAHGRSLALSNVTTRVAWAWHVGRKPALRVVTEEGYEITVTPEHRFLTPTGWKEARDLKPGDKIMLARPDPASVSQVVKGIDLDEDVAFALGWLVGDGTLNKYYVAWYFNEKEKDAMRRIRRGIRKLGSKAKGSIVRIGKEVKLMFREQTIVYKEFMELVGGFLERSRERTVPEIVWRLSPKPLAAFLRGLFTADGTVDYDHAVRLTSASLKLLKDVQVLLTTFGIFSRIYERPYKRTFRYVDKDGNEKIYETQGYYELVISGYSRKLFAEYIGFESPGKTARLSLKKTKIDPEWVTIKSVEDAGEADFYDFTVPEVHMYIASGLVNHNCGEESLYDFESCNLGSINLVRYVRDGGIDWEGLARDVALAVRFLDDVIDVNRLPDERLRNMNLAGRRIGLGANGFADALISLGIRYDSPEGVALADLLASFIFRVAVRASAELAREKGAAPLFGVSDWARGVLPWEKAFERLGRLGKTYPEVGEYLETLKRGYEGIRGLAESARKVLEAYHASDEELKESVRGGIRNLGIMSIAPEGSRSLIAGVNSSIEPLFAIAYVRNLSIGRLVEYNMTALRLLARYNALADGAREYIEEHGTLPPGHPLANLLRTAHEIHWRWHVYMQATWARWNDSGVSKTINLPSDASVEDVDGAFRLAWLLGAFGITVYRDKSKSVQVIYTGVKASNTTKSSGGNNHTSGNGHASITNLGAFKDRLRLVRVGTDGGGEEDGGIEGEMRRVLGETDDPYCRTGSCG